MKTLEVKTKDDLNLFSPYLDKYGFVFDEYLENNNDHYHILKSDINDNYYVIRQNKLTVVGQYQIDISEYRTITKKYPINVVNGYIDTIENIFSHIKAVTTSRSYLGYFKDINSFNTNLKCKKIVDPHKFDSLKDLYKRSTEYDVEEVFSDPQAIYYGLFENDEVVAACRLSHIYSNTVIITKVITDAQSRGKGFGKQLMSIVLNKCHQNDQRAYLFYRDPIARHLYQRLNVCELGTWINIKL